MALALSDLGQVRGHACDVLDSRHAGNHTLP
jgi:hypothetical protein